MSTLYEVDRMFEIERDSLKSDLYLFLSSIDSLESEKEKGGSDISYDYINCVKRTIYNLIEVL